jgi:hypothetical protein
MSTEPTYLKNVILSEATLALRSGRETRPRRGETACTAFGVSAGEDLPLEKSRLFPLSGTGGRNERFLTPSRYPRLGRVTWYF